MWLRLQDDYVKLTWTPKVLSLFIVYKSILDNPSYQDSLKDDIKF